MTWYRIKALMSFHSVKTPFSDVRKAARATEAGIVVSPIAASFPPVTLASVSRSLIIDYRGQVSVQWRPGRGNAVKSPFEVRETRDSVPHSVHFAPQQPKGPSSGVWQVASGCSVGDVKCGSSVVRLGASELGPQDRDDVFWPIQRDRFFR